MPAFHPAKPCTLISSESVAGQDFTRPCCLLARLRGLNAMLPLRGRCLSAMFVSSHYLLLQHRGRKTACPVSNCAGVTVTLNGFSECLGRVSGCCYRARLCLVTRGTSDPPTVVDYINGSTHFWPCSTHVSSFPLTFSIVNIFYPDESRRTPCHR